MTVRIQWCHGYPVLSLSLSRSLFFAHTTVFFCSQVVATTSCASCTISISFVHVGVNVGSENIYTPHNPSTCRLLFGAGNRRAIACEGPHSTLKTIVFKPHKVTPWARVEGVHWLNCSFYRACNASSRRPRHPSGCRIQHGFIA